MFQPSHFKSPQKCSFISSTFANSLIRLCFSCLQFPQRFSCYQHYCWEEDNTLEFARRQMESNSHFFIFIQVNTPEVMKHTHAHTHTSCWIHRVFPAGPWDGSTAASDQHVAPPAKHRCRTCSWRHVDTLGFRRGCYFAYRRGRLFHKKHHKNIPPAFVFEDGFVFVGFQASSSDAWKLLLNVVMKTDVKPQSFALRALDIVKRMVAGS